MLQKRRDRESYYFNHTKNDRNVIEDPAAVAKLVHVSPSSFVCLSVVRVYHAAFRRLLCRSCRGGSGAGSLGGAQQLTGGRGVLAEIFRDLQKPARFSGGGGGVLAEIFRDLQKLARFSGGGGG